jgi:hypothetical protein
MNLNTPNRTDGEQQGLAIRSNYLPNEWRLTCYKDCEGQTHTPKCLKRRAVLQKKYFQYRYRIFKERSIKLNQIENAWYDLQKKIKKFSENQEEMEQHLRQYQDMCHIANIDISEECAPPEYDLVEQATEALSEAQIALDAERKYRQENNLPQRHHTPHMLELLRNERERRYKYISHHAKCDLLPEEERYPNADSMMGRTFPGETQYTSYSTVRGNRWSERLSPRLITFTPRLPPTLDKMNEDFHLALQYSKKRDDKENYKVVDYASGLFKRENYPARENIYE